MRSLQVTRLAPAARIFLLMLADSAGAKQMIGVRSLRGDIMLLTLGGGRSVRSGARGLLDGVLEDRST